MKFFELKTYRDNVFRTYVRQKKRYFFGKLSVFDKWIIPYGKKIDGLRLAHSFKGRKTIFKIFIFVGTLRPEDLQAFLVEKMTFWGPRVVKSQNVLLKVFSSDKHPFLRSTFD